ncbi:HECT-like ubiquitin-conjugating enzyme-binding-domain-containing protein [Suillus discolor]|uniref:HECT-like ubiquitin-conjugating enzyme-binding-domain-containing protein n=1 Tax=Suillus discolor TaxID=1912936 RepID=A0A9P7FA41_9AGAM|nr:HECT-like ubiquitin-conjugating enzyme-binding-domain-containing protein [Suillus discolor]KAG2109926.1 HECT-like ubiquitin-conjugating enzyme-binding-domain-containing protein [Suillus discolor]
MPSITAVQNSCLMTLNNLLSVPRRWQPIVPDRRHSMPASMHFERTPQSYSALETLVLNLRNHDGGEIPRKVLDDHTALLEELRDRVDALAPSMNRQDAHFAQVIVSLLLDLDQLPAVSPPLDLALQASSSTSPDLVVRYPADLLSTLKKQLGDLQLEGRARANTLSPQSPVQTVQTALLWSKIERKLEAVTALCKDRADSHRSPSLDHLPPQYDHAGHDFETPPEYDAEYQSSSEKAGIQPPRSIPSPSIPNEKLRMDFDAVMLAIERLYIVAPQLHNQRVELKSAKLAQMERARLEGPKVQPSLSKGKQKAHDRDMRDLDHMLELIRKASDRKLTDQSVVMDSTRMIRFRQARQEYENQRGAFVDHLIQRSGAGRLHDQDAILQPKVRALDELVTLPEFIRESMSGIPSESRQHKSPSGDAPEEPVPDVSAMTHKKLRSRSISAPQWLRPAAEFSRRLSKSTSRPGSSHGLIQSGTEDFAGSIALNVSYVAEYHETLRHVLVFVAVSGIPVDTELQAEVLPTSSSGTEGDWLVIRSSWASSPPLSLPVQVTPGKKDVQIRQGHYELKLGIANPQTARSSSSDEPTPLMSAEQLLSSKPTSWSCISCSLPLVHYPKLFKYRDLPSEYWEELVDAWMCHADQTLHNHTAKHGRGFWPEDSEALVGGGYILFQQSAIVSNNVSCTEQPLRDGESWLARCICGAIIGRRHERHDPDGTASGMYRLFKYAVRPVSQTAEIPRFPMSAFIMQDMLEHVSAHATYRFVISDEEEERPRILVWLFKPRIRVSYMLPTSYLIPKQGSIDASKVLYKILGPSSSTMALKDLLSRYPGFPQAEHLFYPIDVCRKLAGLLTESTHSYPENVKTMTGLHVGWLNRGS